MKRLRALVGGVTLLLVLAACYPGAASQQTLSYDRQVIISKAKVDLNSWVWNDSDDDAGWLQVDGLQGPWDTVRSTNAGNGFAQVDLNFTESKGNWQVSGRWIDGPVQMEFSGKSEYLTALLNFCLSDVNLNIDFEGIPWSWEIQSNQQGYEFGANDCTGLPSAPGYVGNASSKWISGGCQVIPTLYRSLNPRMIGTGHALILACQNGGGSMENPLPSWGLPSYIEVFIPDTTDISTHAIGDIDYDATIDNREQIYTEAYVEDNEQFRADFNAFDGYEYFFDINFDDQVYYAQGYFENDNSPFRYYHAGGTNTNRSAKWLVQLRYHLNMLQVMPTDSPSFSPSPWLLP